MAVLYSLAQKQTLQTLKFGDGSITAALFWEQKPIVATSTGAIKIFENGDVMGEVIVHAGAATDISLHPSGDILASVGEDKSIVFYDLTTMKPAARIFTQSGSCLRLRSIITFANTIRRIELRPIPPRRHALHLRRHFYLSFGLQCQDRRIRSDP